MEVVIKIEPVTNDKVLRLRNKILRLPLGLNLFEEDLEHEQKDIVFAAYLNTVLVGCVMLKPISNSIAKLRQMAVDIYVQHKGIGSLLVQHAEDYAAKKGYQLIVLHAREEAVMFYEKLGYKKIGTSFVEVGIEHFKMEKQIKI